MQFLAISALALTVIGRCLAEPIPVNVLPRGDPLNGVPGIGSRPFNNLPANDLNAFWPCVRCSIDCAAVAFGCGVVCLAAEIDGPLCGVSHQTLPITIAPCRRLIPTVLSFVLQEQVDQALVLSVGRAAMGARQSTLYFNLDFTLLPVPPEIHGRTDMCKGLKTLRGKKRGTRMSARAFPSKSNQQVFAVACTG